MKMNPILKKELISASRSKKLPIIIFILNIIFFGILMLMLLETRYFSFENAQDIVQPEYKTFIDSFANIGAMAIHGSTMQYVLEFSLFLIFGILYIYIASYCGVSMADERQKLTYEMLITTGIKRRKIIAGKMEAAIIMGITYVCSFIPFEFLLYNLYAFNVKSMINLIMVILINCLFVASISIIAGSRSKNTKTASLSGIIFIALLIIMTIAVIFAVYFVRVLYHNWDYYFSGLNVQYIDVSIGKEKYALLLNPIYNVCLAIEKCTGNQQFSKNILWDIVPDNIFSDKIINNWILISSFLQIVMSIVFIWIATIRINPLLGKGKYVRKMKKLKASKVNPLPLEN